MIAEQETTLDKILLEFKRAENKTKFIKHIALKFDRSAQGIKNNWFYGFNLIPVELQESILIEAKAFNDGNTNGK